VAGEPAEGEQADAGAIDPPEPAESEAPDAGGSEREVEETKKP
jgi:hypothetical protein